MRKFYLLISLVCTILVISVTPIYANTLENSHYYIKQAVEMGIIEEKDLDSLGESINYAEFKEYLDKAQAILPLVETKEGYDKVDQAKARKEYDEKYILQYGKRESLNPLDVATILLENIYVDKNGGRYKYSDVEKDNQTNTFVIYGIGNVPFRMTRAEVLEKTNFNNEYINQLEVDGIFLDSTNGRTFNKEDALISIMKYMWVSDYEMLFQKGYTPFLGIPVMRGDIDGKPYEYNLYKEEDIPVFAVPTKSLFGVDDDFIKTNLYIYDENNNLKYSGNLDDEEFLKQVEKIKVETGYLVLKNVDIQGNEAKDGLKVSLKTLPYANFQEHVFGYKTKDKFETKKEADLLMKPVTVKVWTINDKGQKVPTTKTIIVNRAFENNIKSAFEEIFNDSERTPIKEITGYKWVEGDEKEALRSGGEILIKTVDGYTIAPDSNLVKILLKYHFSFDYKDGKNAKFEFDI